MTLAAASCTLSSCSSGGDDGDSGGDDPPQEEDPADPVAPIEVPVPVGAAIAFASAEGFGKNALGGRGGRVIKVTNLEDSGTGTLRAAVETTGPRTVVFETGGTIRLKSPLILRDGLITIAGQTAPGGGICLRDDRFEIKGDDVIVRHIRCRTGDRSGQSPANTLDALTITGGRDIIIDHVSASWGIDECLSIGGSLTDAVTVQWCLIAEGLDEAGHPSGRHSRGSLIRGANGARFSFHHNLWAHCEKRMPEIQSLLDPDTDPLGLLVDLRNNVMYNWGGDEAGFNANSSGQIARYNFVNNHYQAGRDSDPRDTSSFPFFGPPAIFDEQSGGAAGHFDGNWFEGDAIGDDYDQVDTGDDVDRDAYTATPTQPTSGFNVATTDAESAYSQVTAFAGANLPRDTADSRVVAEVLADIGSIIDSQDDVGGWPELEEGVAPSDSDGDGMPDFWETENGLDPTSADNNGLDLDPTYTNLEHYLAFKAGERLR